MIDECIRYDWYCDSDCDVWKMTLVIGPLDASKILDDGSNFNYLIVSTIYKYFHVFVAVSHWIRFRIISIRSWKKRDKWPKNSKRTIFLHSQHSLTSSIKFDFRNWAENKKNWNENEMERNENKATSLFSLLEKCVQANVCVIMDRS